MSAASSSKAQNFKVGELVWAKLKGYSPWPGKIVSPPTNMKQKKNVAAECVYFFGTQNYAYIELHNLKPYAEFKDRLINACKTSSFKEAVAEIEKYIHNKEEFGEEAADADAEFNRLRQPSPDKVDEEKEKEKEKKKKPKKETNKATKRASEGSGRTPLSKKSRLSASSSMDNSLVSPSSNHLPRKGLTSILDRPSLIMRPDTPPVDFNDVSETVHDKNIKPSSKTFGFLGLGIMGANIVKNLVRSGHKVVVWNRTPNKIKNIENSELEVMQTPSDVVSKADITFCCVSDPMATKEMVFGNCGVLSADLTGSKGYVEMTGIDSETSRDIAEGIISKGGRYLEAQIEGSKPEAENGTLVILAAGDKTVFDDCQSCFSAMGQNSYFLGDIGNATRMNLILKLITGITVAGLAEGMALADRAGLDKSDILEILKLTTLSCPEIIEKSLKMINVDDLYKTHFSLKHMQKDLTLALGLSEALEQPLPLTAAANEVYKHSRRLGYADHDMAAVYEIEIAQRAGEEIRSAFSVQDNTITNVDKALGYAFL